MSKTLIVLTTVLLGISSQPVRGQSAPLVQVTTTENSLASGNATDVPGSENLVEAKRLYKEGVKYGRAGLFKQSAELFERALKLKPDYADAYYGLGHAYLDMQQYQRAVQYFQRAVELNPKDKEARDQLSQTQLLLKAPASAKVIEPEPEAKPLNVSPVATNVNAPAATPLTNKISPNDVALTRVYRVGTGDVLDIRFDEAISPKSTLFTVTSSGLLEHPTLTEPIPVGGLTVDEIGTRIENELKRRALTDNPKVSVGVRDYVSHTILVSGLVKETGTKILRREAIPLYVVVADAQPLPEASRVTVLRNDNGQIFDIDLMMPAEMNLLVRPGDVITLMPSQTQFFYVGGDVKAPGEKTFRRGLTLTQAIIAAGGITKKADEVRLARDNGKGFLVVSRFKLKDIEAGKVVDPAVQAGDRITIEN